MRRLLALAFIALPLAAFAQDQRPELPAPWAVSPDEPARGPLKMVTGVEAVFVETVPQTLTLKIKAVAPSPGYSNFTAEPILTFAPSEDGIYDAVLLGTPPMELTELIWDNVEFEVTWEIRELPNAIKLHSDMNCMIVLLAQSEPAPDFQDCEVVRPAGFPPATAG